MSASLDRYITGNWGEDQFKGCDEYDEMVDHTCSNCLCMSWCPTFEKFCNGDNFDDCLIIQDIMNKQYERDSELSAQMERDYERMMDEDCEELAREDLSYQEQPLPDELDDMLFFSDEQLDDLIEQASWDDKMSM